jgi:hypothetical protein
MLSSGHCAGFNPHQNISHPKSFAMLSSFGLEAPEEIIAPKARAPFDSSYPTGTMSA